MQWVCSVDLFPNEEAQVNLIVDPALSWTDQESSILTKVEETLAGEKLDAILCVAGGWAGGNAAAKGNWRLLETLGGSGLWGSIHSSWNLACSKVFHNWKLSCMSQPTIVYPNTYLQKNSLWQCFDPSRVFLEV